MISFLSVARFTRSTSSGGMLDRICSAMMATIGNAAPVLRGGIAASLPALVEVFFECCLELFVFLDSARFFFMDVSSCLDGG